MNRRNELPPKFSEAERDAYQYAYDCGITGWAVDLATKEVYENCGDRRYQSLVDFRDAIEREEVKP